MGLVVISCHCWTKVALTLRDNVTVNLTDISEQYACIHCCAFCYPLWSAPVLIVKEVFPGADRVVGITAEDSYITLPAELFGNRNNSGEDSIVVIRDIQLLLLLLLLLLSLIVILSFPSSVHSFVLLQKCISAASWKGFRVENKETLNQNAYMAPFLCISPPPLPTPSPSLLVQPHLSSALLHLQLSGLSNQ